MSTPVNVHKTVSFVNRIPLRSVSIYSRYFGIKNTSAKNICISVIFCFKDGRDGSGGYVSFDSADRGKQRNRCSFYFLKGSGRQLLVLCPELSCFPSLKNSREMPTWVHIYILKGFCWFPNCARDMNFWQSKGEIVHEHTRTQSMVTKICLTNENENAIHTLLLLSSSSQIIHFRWTEPTCLRTPGDCTQLDQTKTAFICLNARNNVVHRGRTLLLH